MAECGEWTKEHRLSLFVEDEDLEIFPGDVVVDGTERVLVLGVLRKWGAHPNGGRGWDVSGRTSCRNPGNKPDGKCSQHSSIARCRAGLWVGTSSHGDNIRRVRCEDFLDGHDEFHHAEVEGRKGHVKTVLWAEDWDVAR